MCRRCHNNETRRQRPCGSQHEAYSQSPAHLLSPPALLIECRKLRFRSLTSILELSKDSSPPNSRSRRNRASCRVMYYGVTKNNSVFLRVKILSVPERQALARAWATACPL